METTQQFIHFFPLEEGHQPKDISTQIMTLRLSKHRFLSWCSMFQRRRRYFRLSKPCWGAAVHCQTKDRKKSCSSQHEEFAKTTLQGFAQIFGATKFATKRCTCIHHRQHRPTHRPQSWPPIALTFSYTFPFTHHRLLLVWVQCWSVLFPSPIDNGRMTSF